MRVNKQSLLFGLASFLAGIAVAEFRTTHYEASSSEKPVPVDVCFLFRNPDLIGSRRFITSAVIASAFPHGAVLESESCPKRGASFTEELENQDFTAELNQRFKEDPYGSVPVLFEGTLYRPALLRRIWFRIANHYGAHDQRAPIIVKRYKAVGKKGDTKLIELPDNHP
jgi:hypothetical protein